MRVAWIGGVSYGGGAGQIGSLTLLSVLKQGIEIDYYKAMEEIPSYLLEYSNLSVIETESWWKWGQWYSDAPITAFFSSTFARIKLCNLISDKVLTNHLKTPYDCIFQFSQSELFRLGQYQSSLPPILIYPGVHAAGEFYWHRQESRYAREVESFILHYFVRAFLMYRSWFQCREMQKPNIIIGMSHRFNQLLQKDYRIPSHKQRLMYHPIQPLSESIHQYSDQKAANRTEVNLLFISRMSVRKGLQYIIELTHQLSDLEGQVTITLIGGATQWSNYVGHVEKINPKIARYISHTNRSDLDEIYANSDALLIPSVYEPGGIVVGEALSHGLCVVASDAIGSAEVLEGDIIREFPAGDMNLFEQEVRRLVSELQNERQSLRNSARDQCKKHFSPEDVAQTLIGYFQEVSGNSSESDRVALSPQPSQYSTPLV
jgi:glycosyltransferase involved in cell wall biosynthesis